MCAGHLYPPGNCNDTARKRQERWKQKRSFKRAGADSGATPRKRKSSEEEEDAQDDDPVNDVAAGSSPDAGVEQSQGAGSQKKRPRTKKARLEAMQSQTPSQPTTTKSPPADRPAEQQQVAQTPESIETCQAGEPQHCQGDGACGSQPVSEAAVQQSLPTTADPSPAAATPQARRPRTKKARLEAKHSASLASQSSAELPASSSPASQSPEEQAQQENIELQPCHSEQDEALATPSTKRPRTKKAKMDAKRSGSVQQSSPSQPTSQPLADR